MFKISLFEQKMCYFPTWQGMIFIFAIVSIITLLVIFKLESFFIVTDRVKTKVLVVEGWIPEKSLKFALKEFKDGNYDFIFTTGLIFEVRPSLTSYKSHATLAKHLLVLHGGDEKKIIAVPAGVAKRNRTFASALALKKYFRKNDIKADSFNIITVSHHSRRTRLLFEKAFGDDFNIGIISSKFSLMHKGHWMKSSYGLKTIFGEAVSYIYAKLFFFPDDNLDDDNGKR